MSTQNEQERVLRTIESSSLATGGQLAPTQQKEFFKLVRSLPGMFSLARFESVDQKKHLIDRMHIGEPITHSVEENTNTAHLASPKTSQIEINTSKLKSSWNITTETLIENIEKKGYEQTIMEGMSKRIGTDMELLGIQGDKATYAAVNNPYGYLLRRLDGWDLKTQGAHIIDCGGATIGKDVYAEMIRRMPQQYLADPDLRWITSKIIDTDWTDTVADRLTNLGDNAYIGKAPAPYGIPQLAIPLIPADKAVSITTSTPAAVLGTRADAFKIVTGTNDKILINIDAAGDKTVTIPEGVYFAAQIANMINAEVGAIVATDDGFGRLKIQSTTKGALSTVNIKAIASDAYTELGLSVAVTTGVALGQAGDVKEGSFIWLANPKNFIYAFLNKTRVFTEFNKDYDRLEVVVYNEMDVQVENLDAIVKATNLRRKPL